MSKDIAGNKLFERFRQMAAKANNALYALSMPHELMSIIKAHDTEKKQQLLKAIGENEPISNKLTKGNKPNYKFIMNRNKFRAKLRQAVEEVYSQGGE